jgi:hypothetical protein
VSGAFNYYLFSDKNMAHAKTITWFFDTRNDTLKEHYDVVGGEFYRTDDIRWDNGNVVIPDGVQPVSWEEVLTEL